MILGFQLFQLLVWFVFLFLKLSGRAVIDSELWDKQMSIKT